MCWQSSSNILMCWQSSSNILMCRQSSSNIVMCRQSSSNIIMCWQSSSNILMCWQSSSNMLMCRQSSSNTQGCLLETILFGNYVGGRSVMVGLVVGGDCCIKEQTFNPCSSDKCVTLSPVPSQLVLIWRYQSSVELQHWETKFLY